MVPLPRAPAWPAGGPAPQATPCAAAAGWAPHPAPQHPPSLAPIPHGPPRPVPRKRPRPVEAADWRACLGPAPPETRGRGRSKPWAQVSGPRLESPRRWRRSPGRAGAAGALAHTGSAGATGSGGSPADHAVARASPPRGHGRRSAPWVESGPSVPRPPGKARPAPQPLPSVHAGGRNGLARGGQDPGAPRRGSGSCWAWGAAMPETAPAPAPPILPGRL